MSAVITTCDGTTLARFGWTSIRPTVATWSWPRCRVRSRTYGCDRAGAVGRVVPQAHRRRSCVSRLPDDEDLGPRDALDAVDDADGDALVLENRALLDVEFDVRMRAPPGADRAPVPRSRCVRVRRPAGHRRRLRRRRAPPRAACPPTYTRLPSMSGGKRAPSSSVKNATCTGRRVMTPCVARVSTTSKPAEHAEIAVESATGADGVDVRARSSPARASGRCRAGSPTTLPIASIATSRPRSRIQATTRSRPSRSASVRARRALPHSPFGPSIASDLAERIDSSEEMLHVDSELVQVRLGDHAQRTGSSNRATSARASQNASTAASNRVAPRSAVATVGSPMWPSGPKSFDNHPKPTAPPKRT